MNFLCALKERLNTIILSDQAQGDKASGILVSDWEYDKLKIWCVFNTLILESLRFECFS